MLDQIVRFSLEEKDKVQGFPLAVIELQLAPDGTLSIHSVKKDPSTQASFSVSINGDSQKQIIIHSEREALEERETSSDYEIVVNLFKLLYQ